WVGGGRARGGCPRAPGPAWGRAREGGGRVLGWGGRERAVPPVGRALGCRPPAGPRPKPMTSPAVQSHDPNRIVVGRRIEPLENQVMTVRRERGVGLTTARRPRGHGPHTLPIRVDHGNGAFIELEGDQVPIR